MSDNAATEQLARWRKWKTKRIVWDTLWDQISRYCVPRKGNILTKVTSGGDKTQQLYDTTAGHAGLVFASGCITHICPAGDKWLRLQGKGKKLDDDATKWWDDATDALMDALYDSNLYEALHEDFNDAGHFCSSLMFVDEDEEQIFNYVNIPVGTFVFAENHRGQVDTVARDWKWTARQAAQMWGKDKLGKMQLECLNSTDPTACEREFTYIHIVEPRQDHGYQGGHVAGKLRPWKSTYICEEDQQIIEEGGYYTWPYPASRLLRSNNEVYGRGPGTEILPEVRMVNAMQRDYILAVEKGVKPSWLMGTDADAEIDNRPNGQSYWDASRGEAAKPEVIASQADLKSALLLIQAKQKVIEEAYFVDLFQMLLSLNEQKREKTAYEVQQMVAEQLLLFSPLFNRMVREKLTPIIERAFNIMCRKSAAAWARGEDGVLPLPPQSILENPEYNCVYISKIALAIKAAENQSFATMMTLVEQAAAIDPSVVDILDVGAGVRRVARNIGTPSALIRSDRDAQKRGADRAKAQQAAMGPENAELATRSVKNLGAEAQTQAARKIVAGSGQPG